MEYDDIVIGLGAMGSATAYQLAKRGRRVLGLDRYSPPHDRGSSHGETRITRTAIGEGAAYTPFVRRSNEILSEIEKTASVLLRTVTGALIVSSPSATAVNHVPRFFVKTLEAARDYGVPHELIGAAEIRRRFPALRVKSDEVGYYEPEAGYVRPERCITAQLALARAVGADIRRGEGALEYGQDDKGVFARTAQGTYRAARGVLSAGAWIPEMLGGRHAAMLTVRRQVIYWFDVPDVKPFDPKRFPVFYWELQGERQGIYGFPAVDGPAGGMKIATEQYLTATTPDALDRTVSPEETAAMHEDCVKPYLKGVGSRCLKAYACMYTVTPDAGFIIDRHPAHDAIMMVSACSGHGFKHSPAIGEAVAQTIVDGRSDLDLSPFRLDRFQDLLKT